MSELTLQAQPRNQFGKGASRRIRRADQVPAVMYGHGTPPVHITLPGHETMLALKHPNALLTIVLDGVEQLALAKDVQRDPIKPVIEHVDLVVVRRDEKVTVDVQVHVVGEAAPQTLVTVESQVLQLEVAATAIPEQVEVSVDGLAPGSQVHAGELVLPPGATLVSGPDLLVVNVGQQATASGAAGEAAGSDAETSGEPAAAAGAG
ncbi:MAG: 50S ribosomal protein L25/general stress protein Ctc [Angustibacter sp.]